MNQSEIARKTGVSQGAVSLVLNNPTTTRVSELKKRAIVKCLKETSNMNAFSRKKSWNLGYVTDPLQDVRQDFYGKALSGIEETATASFYNVIIECYRGAELNLLRRGKVDGLIIRSGKAWEGLRTSNPRPLTVLLNCASPILECDVVMPDNRGGVFKALEYLRDRGCRKAAFLGGHPDYSCFSCNYSERQDAFASACRHFGLDGIADAVEGEVTGEAYEMVAAILKKWRAMKNPPDGIVAVNHLYGAMAFQLSPEIPVVAGDNKIEAGFPGRGMHMLVQNSGRMGELAAELLIKRLNTPSATFIRIDCDVKLVMEDKI